ncbi:hypothetical protein WMF26_06345 [Sorangium sp. So ce185]|uniref:hypothetical protein n=1 Tax=Sorangium sp. So ce185 TaxID=3133287 RepID=UPI003F5E0E1F
MGLTFASQPRLARRAVANGERLEVLKDYPASPDCTPPFAPVWIADMVRRQEAGRVMGGGSPLGFRD